MKKLKVALIGCGIISVEHIRAYSQHAERAQIVVCCDIDPEKAAQRATLVGRARVVTRFDDVLNDPEVDAVEICTPHYLHTEAVIAAAKAGKHILCQKPLAKTLEECDQMIAAAAEAGVTLFYGEMNRTLPSALHASSAHWQGGIYMTTAWRYNPAITGGGQLLDGGIHAVDLMLGIGGSIEAVSCYTTQFRPELGGEDTSILNARFTGGHLGTLFTSQAAGIWVPEANFIAYGTEGALTLGGTHGALALHRPDLPDRKEVLLERNGDSFAAMIGRYLDTVVDGAPSVSPGSVGKDNLAVVLAAYESVKRKQEVRIAEIAG
jgi:predicted dehydrogenase